MVGSDGAAGVRRLAAAAAAAHVAGLSASWFYLRPGSFLVPLEERLAYLGGEPVGWRITWCVWVLCALALSTFARLLARSEPSARARAGVLLVRLAAALDVSLSLVFAFLVPSLYAARPDDALAIHRGFELLSVVGANGTYSLGVLVVTGGLGFASAAARRLAWLTAGSGWLLAAGGALESAPLVAAGTPATILLATAWMLALARDAGE
ncbi:MAG: hypothetical protein AAF682_12235 [Planctomycetota bacterium]